MPAAVHPASFRDPSGFVFLGIDGRLFRQVNRAYADAYRRFIDSGLYDELADGGLLVSHEEAPLAYQQTDDAAYVLEPRKIPFVSYPYEWCFGQLKDAALLTLDIQRRAMGKGFSLKDCSAYNVQYDGARPVFIDTLSFETLEPGAPWVAYRQFCQHFLAPLALMAKRDVRLSALLRPHLDGIPLDFAARLLPWTTRLSPGLMLHLHLHARAQIRTATQQPSESRNQRPERKMSERGLQGIIESLEKTVRKLELPSLNTLWSNYYATHSYSEEGAEEKQIFVRECLARIEPETVWDLGANTGVYSRIAGESGSQTVAFDVDWGCVETHYRACRKENVQNVTPLLLDLTNPSPALGWAHAERESLAQRGPADAVLALALAHHLVIGNNTPLPKVAAYLRELTARLIIEFVPKDDPQTQRLLETRRDIFGDYTQENFEAAFQEHFRIAEAKPLRDSNRRLYLMEA